MSTLRVATIGAGYFSRFHHDAWSRLEDATLVAVCDQDAAKAQDYAERFAVPLNAMCSRKCAMPFWSSVSCRPPASTQMPIEADCSPGIRSVAMRKPLDRVCSWTLTVRSSPG